ncbi:hypothetical protein ACIGPN_05965 [Streptomyces afghaniensis]|uniref:deoxynucleotide monophosphate kinase family protein n=1 Tax=Streptomyces afghaniensis TaxID=66865 RepID=UPI0037D13DA3
MTMRNIGIIGKKRSGKDTAADHLVRIRAYTKLAFADPLKEMALKVDPLIPCPQTGQHYRLTYLVEHAGWEFAKDNYPEVRRILQHLGQAQREQDEAYWVNAMRPKLNSAEAWNMPVVVTDVRYRNEALMLRARGFRLVRIVRPAMAIPLTGTGKLSARYLSDPAAEHSSETELDTFAADLDIINDGSLDALHGLIESAI